MCPALCKVSHLFLVTHARTSRYVVCARVRPSIAVTKAKRECWPNPLYRATCTSWTMHASAKTPTRLELRTHRLPPKNPLHISSESSTKKSPQNDEMKPRRIIRTPLQIKGPGIELKDFACDTQWYVYILVRPVRRSGLTDRAVACSARP